MRFFIYLAYDGTAYHGWQQQPNGISVQQCINNAIQTLLRENISIIGAGRTDTGVHAHLMVAHFDSDTTIQCDVFTEKLNYLLPKDIVIHKTVRVRDDVHARFSALSRTYKYYITTIKDPFSRDYKWYLHYDLDIKAMNEAAALLSQCTDFTSFCKLHSNNKTNICHILQAEWTKIDDNEWVFTIKADRFLRNMVRAVVGTLIDVGRRKISLNEFHDIIFQKDRCKAGSSAPACGLFLYDITYPKNITI